MKSLPESPSSRATASPRWFGAHDRPLFGWVHRPAGDAARALVVICPSMGQDAVFSHYLLRSIADELAERGFVVVRFDYDGTGDSSGNQDDPDRVAAWLDSIDRAVDLGREHTDAPLVLFGFRLGALLATEAAARSDVHGLLLWDSPRSGRQYLRELVMQHNASVGMAESGTGAFTALGLQLTAEARAAVSKLNLQRHQPLPADAALVLSREAVADAEAVSDRLGRPVDHVQAADQDDFLSRQALPHRSTRAVLDWCERVYPNADQALHAPPALPATFAGAEPSVSHGGVREHVTSVGPNGLFGIVAEPDGPVVSTTTVVFVPDSITSRNGLSRIWTELARQWAAAGVRSLRFDLSGCADSPARDGQPPFTVGVLTHLDDATDALRHANADPADTIVVGLCSGGYLALEAALALQPRGVAMVNPVLSFITPEGRPDPKRHALVLTRRALGLVFGRATGKLAQRLSHEHKTPAFTTDPNFAWERAFEACFWQVYLSDVAPWIPDWMWRGINAALTNRTLTRILQRVRRNDTRVLLLAGDPDHTRSTLGSHRGLRTLSADGGVQTEHLAGVDHALMRPGDTARVSASLTRFVLASVAMPPAATLPTTPPGPVAVQADVRVVSEAS